jgi:hypothetical protein
MLFKIVDNEVRVMDGASDGLVRAIGKIKNALPQGEDIVYSADRSKWGVLRIACSREVSLDPSLKARKCANGYSFVYREEECVLTTS